MTSSMSTSDMMLLKAVLCTSILSILGSLFIIVNFTFIRNLRSFRHRIILGLTISHLFLALNFLSSTAKRMSNVSQVSVSMGSSCSTSGLFTQMFLLQIDIWVFAISIITFVLLKERYKRMGKWVQTYQCFWWFVVWSVSIVVAGVVRAIWSYQNVGGYCWLGSPKIRLLIGYLPRWILIVISLGLYINIFTSVRQVYSHPQTLTPLPVLSQTSSYEFEEHKEDVLMSGAFSDFTPESESPNMSATSSGECVKRRQSFLMSLGLMAYTLAYIPIWILPTCLTIYQLNRPAGRMSQASNTAVDICLILPGFVNAFIYVINERRSADWGNVAKRVTSRIVCSFGDNSVRELPGIRRKRTPRPFIRFICSECSNLPVKIFGKRAPTITTDMIQKPRPVYFGPRLPSTNYEMSLTMEMVQAVCMDSANARPQTPAKWI